MKYIPVCVSEHPVPVGSPPEPLIFNSPPPVAMSRAPAIFFEIFSDLMKMGGANDEPAPAASVSPVGALTKPDLEDEESLREAV